MTKIEQAGTQVRRVSRLLAAWIQEQPAIGEESATDWFLYKLSKRLCFLRYRKFTRHQEGHESGADWDWWIVLRRGSIGFRVQAKKVTSGVDHYRGLAYRSRTGLQMELLLESSRTANMLAFYALYSGGVSGSNTMCGGSLGTLKDEGIFLAAASTLHDRFIARGRSRIEADALLGYSNPLSCLFCCPMVREPVNPDGFYQYLEHYYPGAWQVSPYDKGGERGFHSEPPPHISSFLQFGETIPDSWEAEHWSAVRETKAIVVLDLRGDEK